MRQFNRAPGAVDAVYALTETMERFAESIIKSGGTSQDVYPNTTCVLAMAVAAHIKSCTGEEDDLLREFVTSVQVCLGKNPLDILEAQGTA